MKLDHKRQMMDKRLPFTDEDDKEILKLVKVYKRAWTTIAEKMDNKFTAGHSHSSPQK